MSVARSCNQMRLLPVLFLVLAFPITTRGADYDVNSQESLLLALHSIASTPQQNDLINVIGSFSMEGSGPEITKVPGFGLTVEGNGNAIFGREQFRPFFVEAGLLEIRNLDLTSLRSQDGSVAGFDLGAQGSVLASQGGTLVLSNVNFSSTLTIEKDPPPVNAPKAPIILIHVKDGEVLNSLTDVTIDPTTGLIKSGLGELQLMGTTSDAAQAILNEGLLSVNGAYDGTVLVNGGTLGGSGQIGSVIVGSLGRISAGNSIGTLTVAGNLTQNPGSVLQVELNAAGQSDLVQVTGSAILNGGTVSVLAQPGSYQVGTQYVILTAGAGIAGTYDQVTDNLEFFDFDPEYQANQLLLQLVVSDHFVGMTHTPNQRAVASAIQSSSTTTDADLASVIDQFQGFTQSQARQAVEQLGGEIYPNLTQLSLEQSQLFLRLLSGRLRGLSPSTVPGTPPVMTNGIQQASFQPGPPQQVDAQALDWQGWVQGYGLNGNFGCDCNSAGLDYSSGGAIFTLDRWLANDVLVGAAGGFSHTNVDGNAFSGDGTLDSFQLAFHVLRTFELQGGYESDPVVLWPYWLATIGYAHDDQETTRFLPAFGRVARGDTSADQLMSYFEAGLNWNWMWWSIQPFAGFQFLHLAQQGLTETGAGSVNLVVGSRDLDSYRFVLGGRITSEMGLRDRLLRPYVDLRWMHELGESQRTATSTFTGSPLASFAIQGVNQGRAFFQLESGVVLEWTPNLLLYLSYYGQITENSNAHVGAGGVEIRW